jgi:hypothetical protein
MSLQLILFPQSYEGYYNSTSATVTTQYVADNSLFLTSDLDTSVGTTLGTPCDEAIDTDGAIIGAWKRYHTTGTSYAVTTPPDNYFSVASGVFLSGIEFFSHATQDSHSGIYQKIDGLVVGQSYTIVIDIEHQATGGILTIGCPNRTDTLAGGGVWNENTNVSQITRSFVAVNTEEILVLDYLNDNGDNLKVSKVSITHSSQVVTSVYDGQVLCDLYEEEEIPLTLSIDEFKNAAESIQSYSKAFKLPATKRNNKIFSHLFDVTRSVDNFSFSPYKKTKCILKQDGLNIFEGFLKLIDINNKEGEISYNVNLYSDPIVLAETLKDKKLKEINMSELNHDYYAGNIKNSWTGVLDLKNPLSAGSFAGNVNDTTTDVLKYPFVNWIGTHNANSTHISLEYLEDVFRPFIKCKYIFDRIMSEAEFTYDSDFLNSTKFTKLFMDFNFGGDRTGAQSGSGVTEYASRDVSSPMSSTQSWKTLKLNSSQQQTVYYNKSTGKLTAQSNNTIVSVSYSLSAENTTYNPHNSQFRILKTETSGDTTELEKISDYVSGNWFGGGSGSIDISLNNGDTIEFQHRTNSSTAGLFDVSGFATMGVSSEIIEAADLLQNVRGDLGQWDFVKGIFTMFNLVVMQDKLNPTNLIIEPYNDIFIDNSDSVEHDWTTKIDATEIKLKPIDLTKYVHFKYETDDSDYNAKKYNKAVDREYGEKILELPELTLLEGEQEIIATPFASTVCREFHSSFDNNLIVPAIYSSGDNDEFSPFENLPRILYDNGVNQLGAGTYSSNIQNHVSSKFTNEDEFLQFSHLSAVPSGVGVEDYNFESEPLIGNAIGVPSVDNLYSLYWSPYFDELYNEETRVVTLKVNLTASDINTFNFYDTVFIKNRSYRVNKIEYKPNGLSKVEFLLIP